MENGKIMKAATVIAAVVILLRIVLERIGAPESVNNVFGVAWMYFIVPVVIAWAIAGAQDTGRYKTLFKDVFLFALYTRLMVMATYILAYYLGFKAPRFSTAMGGNVGPDVSFVQGVVVIPARNALMWIVMAVIVGMILGSAVLLLKRKKPAAAAA